MRPHRLRRCRYFDAALRQAYFSLAGRVSTSDRRLMARDEDDFRIRPGKVRYRGGARTSARRIGSALHPLMKESVEREVRVS